MAADVEASVDRAITDAAELSLRPRQRQAFLSGRDVFVCLPTGSGKSLCYCLAISCVAGRSKQSLWSLVPLLH